MLAATAGGAELFALAATERWTFQSLLLHVGVPAALVVLLVLALAVAASWRRLARGIIVGVAAGALSTIGLEMVRYTGFRVFHTMPGDLPMLMGIKATGRIMVGPSTTSTILGYLDHYWNGALFGVIFALIMGGFPAGKIWAASLIGMGYGLVLGYGFVSGPLPRSLGIGGIFATVSVSEFQATVYLGHAVFGAILGLLVYRGARGLPPLWSVLGDLQRAVVASLTTKPANPLG
ncbi:hypothetical protein A5630_19830 [Mycolicibacterium mucogenicum]|uniref:Uncharacterized protein n=2 Tax=Mycolicibacterium mucogenicum TaxID=56689 RepID=A0A1A3H466_MYCMU|nr:hypothetical protein A5630_19830 [Mycolicibacterium mucogenicum]